jgi:hypothetical protein
LRVLDPVFARWESAGHNVLTLLPETRGEGIAEAGRTNAEARATLLAGLDAGSRRAVFTGTDATAHLMPVAAGGIDAATADADAGRETGSVGLEPDGAPGRFRAVGWLPHADFALARIDPGAGGPVRSVRLPWFACDGPVEIWWTGLDGSFSHLRRVVLPYGLGDDGDGAARVLRLDALPHFDGTDARALRLVFPTTPVRIALDPAGARIR